MSNSKPRIAVIGAGAVGGFYGLLLARAGFDVHFLLRNDYETVSSRGLLLRSRLLGDFRLEKVNAYRDVDAMPRCDWLLLGTKTTTNSAIAPLVVRLAAADAKILVLQNGLNVEDELRPLIPESLHLLGGLCWVGVERETHGVIDHIALGNVDIGYHSGPAGGEQSAQQIVAAAVGMFKESGVESAGISDLTLARWKKLAWNIPYNGISVLLDSGTQQLMANQDTRELIRAVMQEVIRGAAACGHLLADDTADQMLTLTDNIADYQPSMYLDNKQRRPMELDAMYAAPLDATRNANYSMPRVEAMHQALRFIDARNQSGRAEKLNLG